MTVTLVRYILHTSSDQVMLAGAMVSEWSCMEGKSAGHLASLGKCEHTVVHVYPGVRKFVLFSYWKIVAVMEAS